MLSSATTKGENHGDHYTYINTGVLTGLNKGAFSGCDKLIQKENGVSYVDKWVIGCDGAVTSANLRENTVGIADNAFYKCSNLTSIEIPNGVTSIGWNAFSGCSSLASIEIPSSVTSIGSGVFSGCDKLIQKENGVSYVDKWVIGCDISVTSANLRENTVGIAGNAFYKCSSLTSITIPNSVTSIGSQTFFGCSNLTSIEIPSGVTSIGNYAFYGCSSLTSIEIPSGVTSIGNYTFFNCDSLKSITIPNSVTSIGNYAFSGCRLLSAIYYKGAQDEFNAISISSGNSAFTDAMVYYYSETEPTDTTLLYWHYDTDGKTPIIWAKKETE